MEEAWLRIILNDVIAGEDDVAVFGGDGDAAGIGDVMGGMEEMDLPAGDLEGGGWGSKFAVPMGGLVMEQYLNCGLSEESKKRSKALQEEHIEYNMD